MSICLLKCHPNNFRISQGSRHVMRLMSKQYFVHIAPVTTLMKKHKHLFIMYQTNSMLFNVVLCVFILCTAHNVGT